MIPPAVFIAVIVGAALGFAVAIIMESQRRVGGILWGVVTAVVVAVVLLWFGGVL